MHGITPAGAGKTDPQKLDETITEDHPRRCGENAELRSAICRPAGSPPQVRGKQCVRKLGKPFDRITPAGAGKTEQDGWDCPTCQDHPRRCGENPFLPHLSFRSPGSPPQVRGKPCCTPLAMPCTRITPAGAGKTPSATIAALSVEDHPRRCGENMERLQQRRT